MLQNLLINNNLHNLLAIANKLLLIKKIPILTLYNLTHYKKMTLFQNFIQKEMMLLKFKILNLTYTKIKHKKIQKSQRKNNNKNKMKKKN